MIPVTPTDCLCPQAPPSASLARSDAVWFTLPALLYLVVNNIRFPIQERVNPAVYSVVWNLKIIGVAGLLACVLGRPISHRQWGGVMLLIAGSTLAEASQWERKDDLKAEEELAAEIMGRSDKEKGMNIVPTPGNMHVP